MVIPKSKVYIDSRFQGNTLAYISRNISLTKILQDKGEDLAFKITKLKEVLQIIKTFESLNLPFYLNDLHEGNFLYDMDEEKIKLIDLDNAYLPGTCV